MKFIEGKNINLRNVEVDDSEFILTLRTNSIKNKYISQTEPDLEKQRDYIRQYLSKKNEEYYFLIENKSNIQLGTIRIYDITNDSFCWGSWLIKQEAPITTAIESALLIYEYGFYQLKFNNSHFDVRVANSSVVKFHQNMGAQIISTDALNHYFIYTKEKYETIKPKYRRFLP